jgi:hypothetical protein
MIRESEEVKSPRITALTQAVENALKLGMSKATVLEICESEVLGAASLRASIAVCQAPDKFVQLSYYEKVIDKQVKDEDILSAVEHAVGEKP